MKLHIAFKTALVGLLLVSLSGCMSPKGATMAAKRQNAAQMRSETLAKLYQVHPHLRRRLELSGLR